MNTDEKTVMAAKGRPSPCPECQSGSDEASSRCRTCNGIMTKEQEEVCVNFFANVYDNMGMTDDPVECMVRACDGSELIPERVARAVWAAWEALPGAEQVRLLDFRIEDELREWLMSVRV